MGIGTNIKRLLAVKKVTIKELAEKTGISVNTLYSLTRRDSESTKTEYLWLISNALGVGIDEIVSIPKVQIIQSLGALDQPDAEIFDGAAKNTTPEDVAALFVSLSPESREKALAYMLDLSELDQYRADDQGAK